MGDSATSMIQKKDETSKSAGDRVRVGLRVKLTGTGVEGDNTQEGNEEALTTFYQDLSINQLRHATRSAGKMSEQRVLFDVRQENMDALADWFAERVDTAMFNQLCGNTAQTDTRYTGHNTVVEPSTNNIIWTDSDIVTGDESLGTTDTFTTAMLDRALTRAKTMDASGQPIIRPISKGKVKGKYVAFLHPWQVYNLRRESTANTVTWWEVNRSALSAGLDAGAQALYEGSLGEYNNIILHESNYIPYGVNSSTSAAITTTRRAVFCGAQAGIFAVGRENKNMPDQRMSYVEETFDYGNQLGVSAGMISGIVKSRYNSADFATIVMSSYAVAP
jgi:N4-gp56 family major capsid protein